MRGIRLYADGIPASMPDGQGQVSHFDLASAGRGFETPTLNELAYRPDGSAGLNTALEPQKCR